MDTPKICAKWGKGTRGGESQMQTKLEAAGPHHGVQSSWLAGPVLTALHTHVSRSQPRAARSACAETEVEAARPASDRAPVCCSAHLFVHSLVASCPDRGSNPQPRCIGTMFQPTELLGRVGKPFSGQEGGKRTRRRGSPSCRGSGSSGLSLSQTLPPSQSQAASRTSSSSLGTERGFVCVHEGQNSAPRLRSPTLSVVTQEPSLRTLATHSSSNLPPGKSFFPSFLFFPFFLC